MSCFRFSLSGCRKVTGSTLLESVLPSLSSYQLDSMLKSPQKTIDTLTESVYQIMKTELIMKGGGIQNKTIRLGGRFGSYYSKGGVYDLISKHGIYQNLKIIRGFLNVQETGDVEIKFVDNMKKTQILVVQGVAGETVEVPINLFFEEVEITINKAGRNNTGVHGLLIEYQDHCDIDKYICENKDLFMMPMAYKLGSLIITEGQFSGELNQRIMQDEAYQELKREWEAQYELLMRNLSLVDSGCLNCCNKPSYTVSFA